MGRHIAQRNLVLGAAAGLLLLLAALAIAGSWPFYTSSSSAKKPWHVVWEGSVALEEGHLYQLDVAPSEAQGDCGRCLSVHTDSEGRISLAAGNGIQGWPHPGKPSYADCIILRNENQSFDSVELGATRTTPQTVALHGWMCATGAARDGLIRVQYNGRRNGRFLVLVRSWGRLTEGL